jgi:hypothetical protein
MSSPSKKRIPDVLLDKVNTFILLEKTNPIIKTKEELKSHKRRIVAALQNMLNQSNGFKLAHQYLTGIISLQKARLNFTKLVEKFSEYANEIRILAPNLPRTFDSNIWDIVFNQAIVNGEDSALDLLASIKAKNLETLNSNEEE